MSKELQKALETYGRAKAMLIIERERVFPQGTRVIDTLHNTTHTVQGHSWYADQVYLDDKMHSGFHFLVKEEDDE